MLQVAVEASGGLERRMTVTVPSERIENEIEGRLRSLSRSIKVAGFRPGKVPMKVVSGKYGAHVRKEVIEEVTQSSFQEAIVQEKLVPVGGSHIESQSSEPGEDLKYTAVFEIYPVIELVAVNEITIEKPVAEITEQDVDNRLEALRQQRIRWEDVDRPAREKDRVIIDYKGSMEGEEFEGGEGHGVSVVIGSGTLIKGFEQKLVGLSCGEEVTMDLVFPEDYRAAALRGKEVRFVVQVHSIAEPHLPEMDEEFVQSFGVSGGGLNDLRTEIREDMHREMEQAIKEKVKREVLDMLFEKNPLELPRVLVDREMEILLNEARILSARQGVPDAEQTLDRAKLEKQARHRVALGLLVSEIARQNGLDVEAEEIRATVNKIASAYDDPENVAKWYYSDRERIAHVRMLVLENRVVDWIMENADVNEKSISFDDLMGGEPSS